MTLAVRQMAGAAGARRRRLPGALALLAVAAAALWRCVPPAAWLPGQTDRGSGPLPEGLPELQRRAALALGPATVAAAADPRKAWGEASSAPLKLDEYGRAVLPEGRLGATTGKSYEGAALFNGKPKVFVAGSTGELGRRVVLDLLRSDYSVICGCRDEGRSLEVQYANRTTARYQETVVLDALIEGGRQKTLEKQLIDASVVVHLAGARFGFDILRPTTFLDTTSPERTDLNGTKALIDAAVAKGVKKFIYVSAILTNARALGKDVYESDAFKNWNQFGNVLDCKHEAEEYLKKSGLDYTIIRPVPMSNNFPRDVGGIWFGKPDSLLLQSGEVGKSISRDDVSLVCLDAIFNEQASRVVTEVTGVAGQPPTPREQWWLPRDSAKKA